MRLTLALAAAAAVASVLAVPTVGPKHRISFREDGELSHAAYLKGDQLNRRRYAGSV